jgi:hypothetical protein
VNQRLDVSALKGEGIKHRFHLFPEGDGTQELPSASELYETGKKDVCPFPVKPFTAFASATSGATLVPVDRRKTGTMREYRVELGDPGLHHYEWSWGTPSGFKPERPRDWYLLEISQREVERVRIVFRLHRTIEREAKPRWTRVTAGLLDDGDPDDVHLKTLDNESEPLDTVRENPFFRCHELTLNRIRRGYDLLVLF